jgi:hypothetical protein
MSEATSKGTTTATITIISIITSTTIMKQLTGGETITLIITSILAGTIAFTIATITHTITTKNKKKYFHIRIDEELLKAVHEVANQNNITASELVRKAIKQIIANSNKKQLRKTL